LPDADRAAKIQGDGGAKKQERRAVFIIEAITKTKPVCEQCATYEEAVKRVEQLSGEIIGLPLIFEELPDGSQRLVREDGKPLQWHRLPDDRPAGPDEPLPMCEEIPEEWRGARPREAKPPREEDEGDIVPLV
jgi:hypothetical protein